MSKPVKNLIAQQYKSMFDGVSGAVIVDIRGITANTTNEMRSSLAEKQIKVTVVKNSLAKRAFAGHDLEPLGDLLDGACTMVYPVGEDASAVTVARELVDWAKKVKELQFRGAILDGTVFGADEVTKLSEFPTKEESKAKIVQVFLSPAQNLVSASLSPGKNIAGILKTIQEKLEAGETIAKAG